MESSLIATGVRYFLNQQPDTFFLHSLVERTVEVNQYLWSFCLAGPKISQHRQYDFYIMSSSGTDCPLRLEKFNFINLTVVLLVQRRQLVLTNVCSMAGARALRKASAAVSMGGNISKIVW